MGVEVRQITDQILEHFQMRQGIDLHIPLHIIAILGAGMHPWGKWGRNFAEYGVVAIKDAIKDAGVDWKDVDFLVGGDTMRNGYPGYVAGATFAKAMGWTGIPIASLHWFPGSSKCLCSKFLMLVLSLLHLGNRSLFGRRLCS